MPFFFTLREVFDMILMSILAGFIFMDVFRRHSDDPVAEFLDRKDWLRRLAYSIMVVSAPILLHELGHKFTALAFGLSATFKAAYMWLGLGVILKLASFPFLFLVPAYVQISGAATPLQHALTAFAGPAVHLVLWIAALLVLRQKKLSMKSIQFWTYMKYINGFLFVFNMLPIPGFDGLKVFQGIISAFI